MSMCSCVRCSAQVDTDWNVECFDMIGDCLCSECEFFFRENPYKRASFALDRIEQRTLKNYQELKDATALVIQEIDHVLGELRA